MTGIVGETAIRAMLALVLRHPVDAAVLPRLAEGSLRVEMDWAPTSVLLQKLESGQRADVLVVTADAMDRLAERGTIDTSSRIDLVRSRIGIAVPRGAAQPDIGTLDAAIQTLRAARSVGYSRGGASGIHFAAAIERLGIAAEINARATIIPAGFTAEQLITGEADIAVQQVSELMTVPGVEIVGSLPEPLGTAAIFSGAVFAGTAQPEAARRLLALLDDPGTRQAYAQAGLEPLSPGR